MQAVGAIPKKKEVGIIDHPMPTLESDDHLIIKSFDVCAKVLVTTQDITVLDVISKNNVNVVKMQPFTQEESLKVNLFLHTILKVYFLSKNSILGKKLH